MSKAFLTRSGGTVSKATLDASSTAERFIYRPNREGIIIYVTHLQISLLDDACFENEYGNSDMSISTGPQIGVETAGATGAFSPVLNAIQANGATDTGLTNAFLLGCVGEYQTFRHDLSSAVNRAQHSLITFREPIEVARKGGANQQFTVFLNENYSSLIDHRFVIDYFESTEYISKCCFFVK